MSSQVIQSYLIIVINNLNYFFIETRAKRKEGGEKKEEMEGRGMGNGRDGEKWKERSKREKERGRRKRRRKRKEGRVYIRV